jgi:hypothetical protein
LDPDAIDNAQQYARYHSLCHIRPNGDCQPGQSQFAAVGLWRHRTRHYH